MLIFVGQDQAVASVVINVIVALNWLSNLYYINVSAHVRANMATRYLLVAICVQKNVGIARLLARIKDHHHSDIEVAHSLTCRRFCRGSPNTSKQPSCR